MGAGGSEEVCPPLVTVTTPVKRGSAIAQAVRLMLRFTPEQLTVTVAVDAGIRAEEMGSEALSDPLKAAWAMPGAKTSIAAAARTAATRPDAGVRPVSEVLRLLRKVGGFLSGPVVHSILTSFMRQGQGTRFGSVKRISCTAAGGVTAQGFLQLLLVLADEFPGLDRRGVIGHDQGVFEAAAVLFHPERPHHRGAGFQAEDCIHLVSLCAGTSRCRSTGGNGEGEGCCEPEYRPSVNFPAGEASGGKPADGVVGGCAHGKGKHPERW